MLLLTCPFCGPRNSDEFIYRGVPRVRPRQAEQAQPQQWRRYLYLQGNVAGWQRERWFHLSGCRRFIEVERNTITNKLRP